MGDSATPWWKKKWGIGVIVVGVIVVAAAVSGPPEEDEEPAASVAAETEDITEEEADDVPPQEPVDVVRAAVEDALGRSNRDVQRVDVSIGEGAVIVEWAINDNLTEGFIKDGARDEATEILEAIAGSGVDFTDVVLVGTFPLTDELGNSEERQVVEASYTSELVGSINFGGFDFKNVFEIPDSVFVHPAFRY